jgi:hypothetical protein
VTTVTENAFKRVYAKLQALGFLLESDPNLPSVTGLVTGERLRGSWWSHPKAQIIFQINEQLDDHADVMMARLISGKVTFVHKKMWPALLAIGSGVAPWQTKGLSPAAKSLFAAVEKKGILRTDQFSSASASKTKTSDAARELEKKLLVVARQMHTESGAHAKQLETWEHWRKRIGMSRPEMTERQAMVLIEGKINEMNREFNGKGRLPWL